MYKEPKRSKWKKFAISLAILLVIVGVFYLWSNSSNKGDVYLAPQQSNHTSTTTKQFSDTYLSFTYSSEYDQKKLTAGGPIIESYILSADTTYTKQISVEIVSPNLSANPDYTSRASQPNLYTAQKITVAGSPATMYVKDDASERTIFIPHGNVAVMLSFSIEASNATGALADESQAALNSLAWK